MDASISQRKDMPTDIIELRTKTNYRNGKNRQNNKDKLSRKQCNRDRWRERGKLGEEVPLTKKDKKIRKCYFKNAQNKLNFNKWHLTYPNSTDLRTDGQSKYQKQLHKKICCLSR